ncbi:Bone morphoproteintic protein 1 [Sparganum proliferum]
MHTGLLLFFLLAAAFAMRTRVELRSTSQNTLDAEGPASEDAKRRSRRAATSVKSRLWPSGIIPYEIGPQFSSKCTGDARCCSNVGRTNENGPKTISIAPSCESVRTVLHELGHAMGFWHEQSRPDRDAYVEILTENIKNGSLYNYEKKDQHEVDSLGEPYDYDSIMHYAKNLLAKPGATETIRFLQCCPHSKIGRLRKPSESDVRQMNKLYSCPSCGQTFLDHSATFASPKAQASYAGASGALDNTEMSTQTLVLQDQTQTLSSHSETSDPVFCSWRIIAASGERIQLTFTHMDMLPPTNLSQSVKRKPAYSSSCISEYVEVRDGYHSGSRLIVTYSEISQCAITDHGCEQLCVDIPGGYKCQCYDGFELLPDQKSCQSLACGDYVRKGSGYITSPGFPKEYPPNSRCIWRIEVPSGFFVVLKFSRFEGPLPGNVFDRLDDSDEADIYKRRADSMPQFFDKTQIGVGCSTF